MLYKYILVLIVFTSIFLRFSFLESVPSGMSYKEATIGWRAQNLIHLGKDEFGRIFPLVFYGWKDIELPIPTYILLPFIALSDNNIFLLRFPFALAGVFTVLGVYFLTLRFFPQEKNLALFNTLIVGISPWGVWLSRFVNETIVGLVFFLWGLYFFTSFKKKEIYIGFVLLILSMLSSKSFLLFILFFPPIIIFFLKESKKAFSLIITPTIILTLIILHPDAPLSFKDNELSLFFDQTWIDNINNLRGQNNSAGLAFLGAIFFNKYYILIKILMNYLSYFNLSYIFARGDGNSLHNLTNFGLFLVTFLPFFIIGLFKFLKESSNKTYFFLTWILIAPLTIIFFSNNPHSDKFILAIFPFSLIIAKGFTKIKKRFLFIALILIFYNLSFVINDALVKESKRNEEIWNLETLKLSNYVENNTKKIWLTDKIDQNPGPKIAFSNSVPFYYTNFYDQTNYYRRWLNKVGNTDIGNFEQLIVNRKNYDFIIVSESENEKLSCIKSNWSINYQFKSILLSNCL